ncbi:hypothetical protein U9M48_044501 [Paspalum notatum var. saurae]|uniref:Uncharacterized protein n=1 Tax=Paspalum notatum var. saurae TaxID=547442 RepID=A0AAQ3UV78_PASNO
MATAAMSSFLSNSPAAGTVKYRSMWRHATAAGGTLHLPRVRRGVKLSMCCAPAPPSDPDTKWWMMPLSPEDLVEPTGQGLAELEAIWNALVQDPLQPILTALQEIKATKGDFFRCRWFHPGIVSGPLLLVAGFHQFYRTAPRLCLDIALGYLCYKLSVLASELKRNRKSNILCARMQHVLLVILLFKGDHSKGPYCYFTRMTWAFVLYVNSCVVVYELIGVKHPKRYLEAMVKTLLTKGGVMKVLKGVFLGIE